MMMIIIIIIIIIICISLQTEWMNMTNKIVRGRKLLWLILTYCSRSYTKRQRKTKNPQSGDSSADTTILNVRHMC